NRLKKATAWTSSTRTFLSDIDTGKVSGEMALQIAWHVGEAKKLNAHGMDALAKNLHSGKMKGWKGVSFLREVDTRKIDQTSAYYLLNSVNKGKVNVAEANAMASHLKNAKVGAGSVKSFLASVDTGKVVKDNA